MGSRKHQSRQSRRQFSASGRPSKQFSGARSTNGTRFTAPTPSGMGGRTSCPQGMHMMGDGSCMPGEYHGAPSSMGRRGRISGGTGPITNPEYSSCQGSCMYSEVVNGVRQWASTYCGYNDPCTNCPSEHNGMPLEHNNCYGGGQASPTSRGGFGTGGY